MKQLAAVAGIITLVLTAPVVPAQQPPNSGHPHRTEMRRGATQSMMLMDSLNRRLDSLVSRMNRAGGNQKITAMAAVINELVAQRRVMQSHMHAMMMGKSGMMRMRNDSASADSTDIEGQHPPQ